MSFPRIAILGVAAMLSLFTAGRPSAQTPATIESLLDRYLHGEFNQALATLGSETKFDRVLKDLRARGAEWVAAGGPAEVERRQLAAATFALEAARADAWTEWRWRVTSHIPGVPGEFLYWQTPPQLIEWGCELFRRDTSPRPVERWWQLAAMSVVERAEDDEFLLGPVAEAPINFDVEIRHYDHVKNRFPTEPRFALAAAVAFEWDTFPRRAGGQQARGVLAQLQKDPDVGAEATLRLGYLAARTRDDDRAVSLYNEADAKTRDPWLVYLARYFKGQALERKHQTIEAERAYRGALAAVPNAQSASLALAALLARDDRRLAATTIVNGMISATPRPADPWRTYANADDRFWPQLIGELRRRIAQ